MEQITIHQPEDFIAMAKAGELARKCLEEAGKMVKAGTTTLAINDFCHQFITKHGATPAPLNYKGYPKSVCTSVNHVVCHGIPSDEKLWEGDIINIDVTVQYKGWHGDTSATFGVGKISAKAQKLLTVTRQCLEKAIALVKPDVTLGTIGAAIQSHAEGNGFSVVKKFCGHGLGRQFHSPPEVLHYGTKAQGTPLKEGMFFTIEPMINQGGDDVLILEDGWTSVTKDRSLSAQFEHSVGVTANGCQVFTKLPTSNQ